MATIKGTGPSDNWFFADIRAFADYGASPGWRQSRVSCSDGPGRGTGSGAAGVREAATGLRRPMPCWSASSRTWPAILAW